MNLDDLKRKATEAAFRLLQDERVQKAMADPRVQQAVAQSMQVGMKAQAELRKLRETVRAAVDTKVDDDTRAMKDALDRSRNER